MIKLLKSVYKYLFGIVAILFLILFVLIFGIFASNISEKAGLIGVIAGIILTICIFGFTAVILNIDDNVDELKKYMKNNNITLLEIKYLIEIQNKYLLEIANAKKNIHKLDINI